MLVLLVVFFCMYFFVFLQILRPLEGLFADLIRRIMITFRKWISDNTYLANVGFERRMN